MNEGEVKLQAKIIGLNVPNWAEDLEDRQLTLDSRGDQRMVQGLPELTDLVRDGGSWHILGAATAALTAVPGTVAGHSLYNGEPDGGRCYAIDSFGCVEIVTDATQQNSLALFAMMNKGKQTAPTDAGLAVGSMSARNYGGKAKSVAGATVVNDVWTPHGPAGPGATAFAGGVWRVTEFPARGLYLLPPAGLFSIAAAKVAATASQIRYFIRWHEVQVIWRS